MRKFTPWSLAALISAAATNLLHSTQTLAQESAAPLPSVTVTTVTERDIAPELSFIGRVEAKEKVFIQARVEGFLEQRLFTEGALVKEGDLLYVLEKAPYEITVAQSQADLAGAEATLKNARSDLSRKEELRKKKVVSEASLDTSLANETSAQASVMQAKASLRKAELNLSYTEIHSPINGQIGSSRYSVGNLVNPGSEPLATITSMDPIYVNVPVSDKIILEVRRNGSITKPTVTPTLTLSDGKAYEFPGEFDFINTEVNQNTNSITTRAVFPNPNHLLVPGQFVNVAVRAKETRPALVIPQSSVQKDQQGYFVLAVNRDHKVEVRRIEVGEQIENDWVVTNGLLKGERIIVQGIQKVRPDMQVNPIEEGA